MTKVLVFRIKDRNEKDFCFNCALRNRSLSDNQVMTRIIETDVVFPVIYCEGCKKEINHVE